MARQRKSKKSDKHGERANLDFEAELWTAADELRVKWTPGTNGDDLCRQRIFGPTGSRKVRCRAL